MSQHTHTLNYNALTVRPGPQRVLFEAGAYSILPAWLHEVQAHRVLVLRRDLGYAAAEQYLPELTDFTVSEYYFGGECTRAAATEIGQLVVDEKYDAIVAIGGGKLLDTAKGAAVTAGNVPVFLLPTLASNCAPYSTISVYYTENHEPDGYDVYALQPAGLLIEPKVIQTAPLETFVAGIGDTLAKWYECIGGFAGTSSNSSLIAKRAAQLCRDVPLQFGAEAITDHQHARLTQHWQQVVESIIVTAGLVGGFGGDAGRATAAHAVSNGLVVHPTTTHVLHGTQVAYGILVQLALEHRTAELTELCAAYPALSLPRSLVELGIAEPTAADYTTIASEAIRPATTIHALAEEFTTLDAVAHAIEVVESTYLEQKEH